MTFLKIYYNYYDLYIIILILVYYILILIKNINNWQCLQILLSSEEQLTSIAERTIIEADTNNDQMISFEEFCRALERTDVEQKMSIRFLNWPPNSWTIYITYTMAIVLLVIIYGLLTKTKWLTVYWVISYLTNSTVLVNNLFLIEVLIGYKRELF